MKLKLISMLAISAFTVSAAAADEGFKISGDFATSVFVESGKGDNQVFPSTGAVSTVSNENAGDFSVDQVELNVEKTVGNSGIVLGIGYGRIFDVINYTIDPTTLAPKSTLNLTNAYFHHKVGDSGLSFKLGKIGVQPTHESYRYMDNMNYTRSYAFNYMNPWFLTGVSADYAINDMFTVGAIVANSTVNTDTDENESKHMGVNLTVKPMEGLNIKINYLTGKDGGAVYDDTTRLNATIGYMIGNMWDLAFHYSSYQTEEVTAGSGTSPDATATSMALYAGAKMETWGAGIRYETVNDDDGLLFTAADNKIDTITATGWYNVDQNATLKLEIASASADVAMFADEDFAADDAMMTYGLGFLYRF